MSKVSNALRITPKKTSISRVYINRSSLASIVSAIMMASALLFIADYLQGQRAQALGQSLFALNQAVNSYETRFSVQLANNQPVSIPGYANVVNSYAPTTTELFELGLLPNQTLKATTASRLTRHCRPERRPDLSG